DHPGRAEAALEALRVKESLLQRMRVAIRCEAFDRCHRMALGTECGDQAAVHRLTVEQHGAGAAVAGIAALLDAEMTEVAQEGAQALPGARLRGKWLAVDFEAHD